MSGLFLRHTSPLTWAARLDTFMNRRAFFALSAISPFARFLPAFAEPSSSPRELKADVCVVGGGVGGVAAALGAARGGRADAERRTE